MATSQIAEMRAEGEVDVDVEEAVREMLAAEEEAEEQDPIEGMGNAQIAEIYHRMKPENQRLFRQFKRFHKRYYETHGHDAPSHQLTRGIIQQMFPGLPSADTETIARRGPSCWPQSDSRSCANSWDWQSQLSYRRTHHHRRHLSTHRHLSHHDFCRDKTRRGWPLNNLRWRQKKQKPSRTSNQGGWPPHIWVPRDCCE